MGPGSYDGMLIENFENFDSLIKLIIRLLSKILGSVYTCKLSSCISITATPYAKLARKRIAYWGKYHIEQWLTGEALQVRKCLAITLSMINRQTLQPRADIMCVKYIMRHHMNIIEYSRIFTPLAGWHSTSVSSIHAYRETIYLCKVAIVSTLLFPVALKLSEVVRWKPDQPLTGSATPE